jgi:hypothetical protein
MLLPDERFETFDKALKDAATLADSFGSFPQGS